MHSYTILYAQPGRSAGRGRALGIGSLPLLSMNIIETCILWCEWLRVHPEFSIALAHHACSPACIDTSGAHEQLLTSKCTPRAVRSCTHSRMHCRERSRKRCGLKTIPTEQMVSVSNRQRRAGAAGRAFVASSKSRLSHSAGVQKSVYMREPNGVLRFATSFVCTFSGHACRRPVAIQVDALSKTDARLTDSTRTMWNANLRIGLYLVVGSDSEREGTAGACEGARPGLDDSQGGPKSREGRGLVKNATFDERQRHRRRRLGSDVIIASCEGSHQCAVNLPKRRGATGPVRCAPWQPR
jgi:hypothetical protein